MSVVSNTSIVTDGLIFVVDPLNELSDDGTSTVSVVVRERAFSRIGKQPFNL